VRREGKTSDDWDEEKVASLWRWRSSKKKERMRARSLVERWFGENKLGFCRFYISQSQTGLKLTRVKMAQNFQLGSCRKIQNLIISRKLLLRPPHVGHRPPKNLKIPSILGLVWIRLYNSKWALILEDRFPLSGNEKSYNKRNTSYTGSTGWLILIEKVTLWQILLLILVCQLLILLLGNLLLCLFLML
jgi:hypothetical protein